MDTREDWDVAIRLTIMELSKDTREWVPRSVVRETLTRVCDNLGIRVKNGLIGETYATMDSKSVNGNRLLNLQSLSKD